MVLLRQSQARAFLGALRAFAARQQAAGCWPVLQVARTPDGDFLDWHHGTSAGRLARLYPRAHVRPEALPGDPTHRAQPIPVIRELIG